MEDNNPKAKLVQENVNDEVKVWASLGATVNIGNFENNKIDIGVSGIPAGASSEYIEEQMKLAVMTIHEIVDDLAAEMGRRLREDYGR